MKGILTINGKTIEIELTEEQKKQLKDINRTGYERVGMGETYYDGNGMPTHDDNDVVDKENYALGSYYNDIQLAKDNQRAENLMRQLRRFAVIENEKEMKKSQWDNSAEKKWFIFYSYQRNHVAIDRISVCRQAFVPYFLNPSSAHKAIRQFKEELIWYFTKYKDHL